ncbi:MAG: response regulator [Magnetococcus sp. DMHC-8]
MSWWLTGDFTNRQATELLFERNQDLLQTSEQLSVGLRRGLGMLHGVPAAVGQHPGLQAVLQPFLHAPPSSQTTEEKRELWSTAPELAALDRWLAGFTDQLGVMSVIWVMNTAGDAILASNHQAPDSFVGTNYRDREYFAEAMAGKQGVQYAVGRRTNIPGFFFSSPVVDEHNNRIGVVAGKIDLSFLASWLGQADALLSDQYGVVILARDKQLEMRALPDSTVFGLPEKARLDRYKRQTFAKLDIRPWSDGLMSDLYRFDSRPVPFLHKTVTLEEGEAFLTILVPMPELAHLDWDHLFRAVLLMVGGSAVMLAVRHVRQRRRSERLLRESDVRLATVFRASPIGIALVRWSDHRVLEANDFLLHLFGCQRAEFAQRTAAMVDLYGEAYLPLVVGLRNAGRVHGLEAGVNYRDGSTGIHLLSAEQMMLSGDLCYLTTVTDITAIKRLEISLHEAKHTLEQRVAERTRELSQMVEELAQSQSLLRTVVDTVPIRVFWKDRDGRYLGCNPPFARDAGKNHPDELLGLDDTRLGWAEQAERYRADDRQVMTSGLGRLGYEEPQSTPDGALLCLRTSKVPLRNNRDEVIGVLGVYEDITEAKQSEQNLNQAMEQLQRAMHQVETASRFKSAFLANMSHEIRTPMNAIIGLADLALHLEMPPRLRDYLAKIANASHSLLRIINDILDFSKIEAGKITLEATDFELGRVMENLADLFRSQAAEKGLELAIGVDPACPTALHGDSLRLEQVLMNLISNAIKFTRQGAIRVWITREPHRVDWPVASASGPDGEEAEVLLFSVQDSGIGLSPEQMAGLFQPFTQADSSTTRQFGGTGLGLSICKRLVELMGGRIWVESVPGQGALFRFTARLACRPEAEQACVLPDPLVALPVLLVDDNAIAREILEVTLRSCSFRPCSVASGAEALQEMERAAEAGTPYPLVLLDYRMPDMDGLETAHRITADVARRADPGSAPGMILLSAFGLDEYLALQARKAGIGALLGKPVTRSRLCDTIMEVLGRGVVELHQPARETVDHQAVFAQIGGARILLVEDNPINQQVAREMLEQVGLVVTVAGNGLEATQMVMEAPFDLICMDIQMPVMDGYTAVRQIRAHARFAGLPIIAMTAHAMDGDRQKSLAGGMNDHITKPVDRQQLYAALQRWIAPADRPKPAPAVLVEDRTAGDAWEMPVDLPGVDVVAGLERLGGNHRLLRSLLLEAGRDFAGVAGKLRQGLTGKRQDDSLSARRLVHAVKGVAGNVSAVALHKVAAALEQAIDARQQDRWPALLTQLEQALTPLLAAIATLEQHGKPEPARPVAVDPVQTRELLNRLAALIQSASSRAGKCFADLQPFLQAPAMAQAVERLDAALERFDFQAAQTALAEIDQVWQQEHAEEQA